MPYITREDGQHFVIPSYRDVLTVKQKNQLKKEILALSKSYGEYITLQKKGGQQYEVAFSPDTGYLLGESVWHHFKKPLDLIYCEAIPNTTEAILVIVKAGSVYLDGSFPVDSIPEELIIFLTQQNNFEIYIHGDVSISKEPESGKFSFEAASIKSFTVLDKPVFPTLALLKIYQLRLVETVLKEQGIGGIPLKQVVMVLILAGLGYYAYTYFTAPPPPPPPSAEELVNPYQQYIDLLKSREPNEEIAKLTPVIQTYMQIPGWMVTDISYANGSSTAKVLSMAGNLAELKAWGKAHNASVTITTNGITLSIPVDSQLRPEPTKIYSVQNVMTVLLDRFAKVMPNNNLMLSKSERKNVFSTLDVSITLESVSPALLNLIGKQFAGLPIVLNNISVSVNNGMMNGLINITVVGS